MSAVTQAGTQPYYYVPAPSRHPAMAAFGLLLVIFGASQWVNGDNWAGWVVLAGLLWISWRIVVMGPHVVSQSARALGTAVSRRLRLRLD